MNPIGSMVLLYMVCHGSHQQKPHLCSHFSTSTMDPSWYDMNAPATLTPWIRRGFQHFEIGK